MRVSASWKTVGRYCENASSGTHSNTPQSRPKACASVALLASSFWNTPSSGCRWPPCTMKPGAARRYARMSFASAGTLPLRSHSAGWSSGGKSAAYAGESSGPAPLGR